MPSLADVVDLLHSWYPPDTADSYDAVGLVAGDPAAEVGKVLLAVDPTIEVAREAVAWGADLLVVHHPLFLTPVSSVAATTPKGRTLHTLTAGGCALLTAHTNADQADSGVSESLALALGLHDLTPIRPSSPGASTGTGRTGTTEETSLERFAARVAEALPATAHGVRVAGDSERPVRRVAVCGGAGDFLLDELVGSDVDVFVTSDLRHHRAGEFLEHGGPALVDVAHWAAEWTWLPVVEGRLRTAMGDRVETRVSTQCTDPWSFRY
ncbi:Nif3-like dinuclear metal center hexameric protein [Nocardioides sp.]|jgi:dinuclear metal center YbgI/SA1388 family protein|uniref:Nif3-like dinuclear metal center hexameric protein n=1 Tax=Nocardioides sp. TaxID=35761 RepID=UPI002603B601|nr:Nif3-like dinuclear metal center hexameric protein [Nocardioides sp.]MCW2736131.1 Nif3-like dinuclear metal center hexameric protein [Nocardioides sp.]